MSYYPTNFYSNYQYGQQYPQYPMSQQQMPTVPSSSIQPAVAAQQGGLQGKIVENADIVRVTDIPFGGYGIFPKADMSEIYMKTWNNNGTTSITTFVPAIIPSNTQSQEEENDDKSEEERNINSKHELILRKIEELENKIDNIKVCNHDDNQSQGLVPVQQSPSRKELSANAY